MKNVKKIVCAGLFIWSQQGYAVEVCPAGSVPIQIGSTEVISCVAHGSDFKVYASQSLFQSLDKPQWTSPQNKVPGIAHRASTSTDRSAFPSGNTEIPNKLKADWVYLFHSNRVKPGESIMWMGGRLSRGLDGSLSFETNYGSDQFKEKIDRYERDLPAFISAVGPSTARLFAERYGYNLAQVDGVQDWNALDWQTVLRTPEQPGSSRMVGSREGSIFVTLLIGASGYPEEVVNSKGTRMSIAEFILTPEFSSLTGQGIVWRSRSTDHF